MKDETFSRSGDENRLMDHMILIGGPPRSGTTFAAKSLNLHPGFIATIDDHVYECWGLYYNRDRIGLVTELRKRWLSSEEVRRILRNHLFADNRLEGAASSDKTKGFPRVSKGLFLFPGSVRSALDNGLERHSIPLAQFSNKWRLCLKSPEISFVLPQLANHFPCAKFVLIFRPIVEIAESMYRIGNMVKRFPVFHKRWIMEKNDAGDLIPPPGIPIEWNKLWQTASNFRRCTIYAASYIRGLLKGVSELDPDRYFVYNHAMLRKSPRKIFQRLAQFLAVDVSGFQAAERVLKIDSPSIPTQLENEYSKIEFELDLKQLLHQIESLNILY